MSRIVRGQRVAVGGNHLPALSRKRSSRGWPGRVGFRRGSAVLPPTSLPAADHPARDLALSPVHPEHVEELLAERGLEVSYERHGGGF